MIIKILHTGQNHNHFYPREVLERDGPTACPQGTIVFGIHRDINDDPHMRDLSHAIGFTTTPAFYANEPDGPGLYTTVFIYKSVVCTTTARFSASSIGLIGHNVVTHIRKVVSIDRVP